MIKMQGVKDTVTFVDLGYVVYVMALVMACNPHITPFGILVMVGVL